MTDELKPCPFCGDTKPMLRNDDDTHWNIICRECGATTDIEIAATEAEDSWNRRADGWVRCADALPEAGVEVLAFVDRERVEMMHYSTGEGWLVRRGHRVGLGDYSEITHWRELPLPPPPEG